MALPGCIEIPNFFFLPSIKILLLSATLGAKFGFSLSVYVYISVTFPCSDEGFASSIEPCWYKDGPGAPVPESANA